MASYALLVIDLQSCYLDRYGDQKQVEKVIASCNRAMATARADGAPMLYIEHEMTGLTGLAMRLFYGGMGVRGKAGFATDRRVEQVAAAPTLIKRGGDALADDYILGWIERKGVETLRVCGQDGNHCIQATVRGALKRGYGVELYVGAVAANDYDKWRQTREQLLGAGAEGV